MKLSAPSILPRLLRRLDAAGYLSVSPAQFDLLRARGDVVPVPVPSDRNPTGKLGVPLFDVRDLDACIDKWKDGR